MKTVKTIFEHILEQVEEDSKNNPLYQFIADKKEWLDDPEMLHCMIMSQFKEIIHLSVAEKFNRSDGYISNIFTDYGLFESNITILCKQFYGNACCIDRSRHIIRSFIKYRLKKQLPVFEPSPQNYHHPLKGTPQQWMNFVEGIGDLIYGKPQKYLVAYKSLIDTHKEVDNEKG